MCVCACVRVCLCVIRAFCIGLRNQIETAEGDHSAPLTLAPTFASGSRKGGGDDGGGREHWGGGGGGPHALERVPA